MKRMTYAEAKKILAPVDPAKRMIDDDGQIQMATQIFMRFSESYQILNGETRKTDPLFLSEKEVALLTNAVSSRAFSEQPHGRPTLAEADRIIKAHTTPSGKVILDDIEGDAAMKVIGKSSEVMMVLDGKTDFNFDYLTKKEIKALKKVAAATGKPIKRKHKKKEKPADKPSFWQRLFRRSHKPKQPEFDWTNPLNWQDVKFKKGAFVLFSHRLNVSRLTPENREKVRSDMARRGIRVEERPASFDDGNIRKGDLTFRVADKKSIENLRYMVFNWAQQPGGRPVEMTVTEYNTMEEKKKALSQGSVRSTPGAEKAVVSRSADEILQRRSHEGSR
ncbi:MAG: hypothetical protein IJV07_03220 [Alphaproteobacteria bacterium]|nr:hypothetical protein [Alphaproteobacteria bacterium]